VLHDVRSTSDLTGRHDEQIGLQDQARLELDVEWRREELTERVRPNVSIDEGRWGRYAP